SHGIPKRTDTRTDTTFLLSYQAVCCYEAQCPRRLFWMFRDSSEVITIFVSPDSRSRCRDSFTVPRKFHSAVCTKTEDASEYCASLETGTSAFECDNHRPL